MSNGNCLDGFRCPKCRYKDRFYIGGHAVFDVTDDCADIDKGCDVEWEESDICICGKCGYLGDVDDFKARTRGERTAWLREKKRLNQIRNEARGMYGCEDITFDNGEIEVREGTESVEGAFVAAWVWVPAIV